MQKQVLNIAKLMQYKLDKNKYKACNILNADGTGRKWEGCDINWLKNRMLEEADELSDAILKGLSPKEIALECADVCNFAMMIADNVGGLEDNLTCLSNVAFSDCHIHANNITGCLGCGNFQKEANY